MADQLLSRRAAVKVINLAILAAGLPHFTVWQSAYAEPSIGPSQHTDKDFRPLFFLPREYACLQRLSELIIPSDDSPGAREAGVTEFIDFMVSRDTLLQTRFRSGIDWINQLFAAASGRTLMETSLPEAEAMLRPLAYPAEYRAGQEAGRDFFALLRDQVAFAFYTSRIGMELLQVPALRPAYAALPDYSTEFSVVTNPLQQSLTGCSSTMRPEPQ